jgi:Sulfotransferase family
MLATTGTSVWTLTQICPRTYVLWHMRGLDAPALADDVRAALPTFFVIGAPKAGTTSLHAYLAEHPEIAMSSNKEPMCFAGPHWLERLSEYGELFERRARVRGESSTAYSAYPWSADVPDRVRATVPEARIIYCVRDPIERMLAHYAQNVWDRLGQRPFDELMDDLEDEMNMPVWTSRYATQYERWAERFDAERILVLEQRDLLERRAHTLRRVFEFLGVDPDFTSPSWDVRHNTAGDHRVPSTLADRLGPERARRLGRLPGVRRLLERPVRKPQLTAEQRRRVVALLEPEAQRFHELTGVAIDDWRF